MTQIVLTSGTTFVTPADWNPAANTIEAIGGGAAGGATVGGAGADYAKVSNQSLSGSIAIAIGAAGTSGGNGGDTTFGSILLAKGGGSASTNIGSTTYAGGTGNAAGGGGGAAGPSGAGGNAPGTTGGTGDNGTVAADASGTEWGTVGSGGGGSAASAGKSVVQTVATNPAGGTTSSIILNLPAAPTAGNFLILEIREVGTGMPSLPIAGWNLEVDTGTAVGSTSSTRMLILSRVSDGTEQNTTFASGQSQHTAVMMEIAGATAVDAYAMFVGAPARISSGKGYQSPSATPTVANDLAIAFGGSTSAPTSTTYTAAAGWTLTDYDVTHSSYTSVGSYQLQDASLSAVSTTIPSNITLSSNSCSAILLIK